MKNGLKINYKVWLEKDGGIVIGQGKELLLRYIDETGSIHQAAKKLNMNYRKAFYYIKAMEERLGKKLVESYRGGATGGGSKLTQEGKELLAKYKKIINTLDETIRNLEKDV